MGKRPYYAAYDHLLFLIFALLALGMYCHSDATAFDRFHQ